MKKLITLVLVGGFAAAGLSAEQRLAWPQFRGPQACGVDASKPLPTTWNIETSQNIRWQTPLPGLAHASPVICGERIYVTTAVGPGQAELKVGLYGDIEPVNETSVHEWRLLALERASGKILWSVPGHKAVPRVKRPLLGLVLTWP